MLAVATCTYAYFLVSDMINRTNAKRLKNSTLFLPGIEPGTFRVLGGCDNHYTTETELVT